MLICELSSHDARVGGRGVVCCAASVRRWVSGKAQTLEFRGLARGLAGELGNVPAWRPAESIFWKPNALPATGESTLLHLACMSVPGVPAGVAQVVACLPAWFLYVGPELVRE